jgi:predicted nucleic acid-binding protein
MGAFRVVSTPLTKFTGTTLYLDTMIPYALLRDIEPAVTGLFERIKAGELHAYTSVLTFDELAYRLLLALIRDQYSGSPMERLRDQKVQMITEFYPKIAPALARLYAFPNLTLMDVATTDLARMSENISAYQLLPRDALHLAAMQACGCYDLVSQDPDFDRVPMVQRYTLTETS